MQFQIEQKTGHIQYKLGKKKAYRQKIMKGIQARIIIENGSPNNMENRPQIIQIGKKKDAIRKKREHKIECS